MLQLLFPAGLWALAALSLPLAIHLWRPPPRTVRLGSLRFLENLPRRLHDLRWRERWLLAVRLALLALLALLLAGPLWQRRPARGPQRWLLLDPTAAADAGSTARARTLKAEGYEPHALAPGFPAIATPPGKADAVAPDLWSLLREADAELPAGSSLAVLSPGRLASLRGSRPAMQHCRVEWVQAPDAPSPPAASLPTPAIPAPLGVLILHDADRTGDARALSAAIRAAAQIGGRTVDVRTGVNDPSKGIPSDAAWIFWLSNKPVPSGWMARGVNVVSEEIGAREHSDFPASWIMSAPDVPGASAFLDSVRLWRRETPPLPAPGVVDWTNGFGRPLLTVEREDAARHWRFYGRFDPAWTDLPRGGALAAWVRGLLLGQGDPLPPGPVHDHRVADPSQCRPSDTAPARANLILSRGRENPVDLHAPLWWLAALLFGLERLWSHRRRPAPVALEPAPVAAAPAR